MSTASHFLPMCENALYCGPCHAVQGPPRPPMASMWGSSRTDTPITADKRCGHNSMPPQELISPPTRILCSPSYCTPLVWGGVGNKAKHVEATKRALSSFVWFYTLSSSLRRLIKQDIRQSLKWLQ